MLRGIHHGAVGEVAAFFDAKPLPSNQRTVSQTLETIHTTAAFAQAVAKGGISAAGFWESLSST